jgi:hypothetical protein
VGKMLLGREGVDGQEKDIRIIALLKTTDRPQKTATTMASGQGAKKGEEG